MIVADGTIVAVILLVLSDCLLVAFGVVVVPLLRGTVVILVPAVV